MIENHWQTKLDTEKEFCSIESILKKNILKRSKNTALFKGAISTLLVPVTLEELNYYLDYLFKTNPEIGKFGVRDLPRRENKPQVALDFRSGFDAIAAQEQLDGYRYEVEDGQEYIMRAKITSKKEYLRSDSSLDDSRRSRSPSMAEKSCSALALIPTLSDGALFRANAKLDAKYKLLKKQKLIVQTERELLKETRKLKEDLLNFEDKPTTSSCKQRSRSPSAGQRSWSEELELLKFKINKDSKAQMSSRSQSRSPRRRSMSQERRPRAYRSRSKIRSRVEKSRSQTSSICRSKSRERGSRRITPSSTTRRSYSRDRVVGAERSKSRKRNSRKRRRQRASSSKKSRSEKRSRSRKRGSKRAWSRDSSRLLDIKPKGEQYETSNERSNSEIDSTFKKRVVRENISQKDIESDKPRTYTFNLDEDDDLPSYANIKTRTTDVTKNNCTITSNTHTIGVDSTFEESEKPIPPSPQFVLVIKKLMKQLKPVLFASRAEGVCVNYYAMKQVLRVILKDIVKGKGYMNTNAIVRLFRETHPRDGDAEFVRNVAVDISLSKYGDLEGVVDIERDDDDNDDEVIVIENKTDVVIISDGDDDLDGEDSEIKDYAPNNTNLLTVGEKLNETSNEWANSEKLNDAINELTESEALNEVINELTASEMPNEATNEAAVSENHNEVINNLTESEQINELLESEKIIKAINELLECGQINEDIINSINELSKNNISYTANSTDVPTEVDTKIVKEEGQRQSETLQCRDKTKEFNYMSTHSQEFMNPETMVNKETRLYENSQTREDNLKVTAITIMTSETELNSIANAIDNNKDEGNIERKTKEEPIPKFIDADTDKLLSVANFNLNTSNANDHGGETPLVTSITITTSDAELFLLNQHGNENLTKKPTVKVEHNEKVDNQLANETQTALRYENKENECTNKLVARENLVDTTNVGLLGTQTRLVEEEEETVESISKYLTSLDRELKPNIEKPNHTRWRF